MINYFRGDYNRISLGPVPLPYREMNGFIEQEIMDEADNNCYASGLLQNM